MTPNDLRALCATPTPDTLLVTIPLATVRALVAAIDAAAEHRAAAAEAAPPAVGSLYADRKGVVWRVVGCAKQRVHMTVEDGRPWWIGAGAFAVQVRMGLLREVAT